MRGEIGIDVWVRLTPEILPRLQTLYRIVSGDPPKAPGLLHFNKHREQHGL